ncbi:hypothetical protein [Caulobacter soli]|uniref:hypothetical protein n=1 Tax=Caulobacter soli TaxID=2708539 RepID=UPI0013ED86A5|nr:hypothetical protein [Caulobacter soli]
MTKPSSDSPPIASDEDAGANVRAPTETPQTPDEVRRGVLQQRNHIQELDGEDPLRGGVDD